MRITWKTDEHNRTTTPEIPQLSIVTTDNKRFILSNLVPIGKPDFHAFNFPSLPQAKQFVENNPTYFVWGHR